MSFYIHLFQGRVLVQETAFIFIKFLMGILIYNLNMNQTEFAESLPVYDNKGKAILSTVTGLGYRIKNKTGVVLGTDGTVGYLKIDVLKESIDDKNQIWFIVPAKDKGLYSFISTHKNYLIYHYFGQIMSLPMDENDPALAQFIHNDFSLIHYQDSFYHLKLFTGQGCLSLSKNWNGELGKRVLGYSRLQNPNSRWQLVPAFTLNLDMYDFVYDEDIKQLLNKNKQVDIIQQYDIIVKDQDLGTKVSRDFIKTIRKSFSWGLNQSLGIQASVSVNAGIPLIGGGVQSTLTTSFSVGSHQDWTEEKEQTISIHGEMSPVHKGIYKMSGWIDVVQNIAIKFRAKVLVSGVGYSLLKNNDYATGQKVSGKAVKSYLQSITQTPGNIKIIQVREKAVLAEFAGVMKSSYGVNAQIQTEKVSDL